MPGGKVDIMAGYKKYSMSNNAVAAYQSGEMPKSKWTKAAIMAEIMESELTDEQKAACKSIKAAALKELALIKTSWHHTSDHYNRTDFCSVNIGLLDGMTSKAIKETANEIVNGWHTTPDTGYNAKVEYLTWTGSRKHPKAEKHIEVCEIRGNWAITENGKKSITSNGFRFIERY